MQFNKVLNASQALILIFITFYLETTLTARIHQKARSASLRIFPLNQRQTQGHGRASAVRETVFDKTAEPLASNDEEGRGLMKKFILFKSLFTQPKSEPSSNIIIISQPVDTETKTPTTTGTTGTTTTTALNDPLEVTTDNTGRENEEENINDSNATPEEILQQFIKETKTNKKRLKKFNRKNIRNRKPQQRLRNPQNKRKRLKNQKPLTEKQMFNEEQQVVKDMKSIKNHKQKSKIDNSNNTKNNKSNIKNNTSNMTSGIFNLNTNMRLQNIMNALRKQTTPIKYN